MKTNNSSMFEMTLTCKKQREITIFECMLWYYYKMKLLSELQIITNTVGSYKASNWELVD